MAKSKYKGNYPPTFLGERVLYLRKTKGISRQTILKETGISNSTLSRIEDNPESYVSSQTVEKLASIFNVTCDYLIIGKEPYPDEITGLIEDYLESPLFYEMTKMFPVLTPEKQEKILKYMDILSKM